MTVHLNKKGQLQYGGEGFIIIMNRYSDPDRLNLARNAAIYLGKSDRENVRRPLSIIRQGHVPEIFRGEYVEFEFVNVSKEVYDHLITYTTRNMRATGGNRALVSTDFTMPSDKMKNSALVTMNVVSSMRNYNELLITGETKQVARSAMPIAANMNPFVYQFNFLTLGQSVFKQRIWEKGAQGNTVKVVKAMFELCQHVDEDLWNTFYEHMGTPAVEWDEVRKKLKKKKFTVLDMLEDMNAREIQNSESVLDYLTNKFGEQRNMWQ